MCQGILDVRTGWLINEEESESDLQMHQLLKQMEETGRARSLQEKQNKKKRKIRIAALTLIMTGITITLLTKINQLENSYQQLQNTLHTQNTVMQNQISSITSSVQQTLDRYNALTLNSDVVVEGYDYASNMVQLSFQARPRTYVSGMKTVFHIDCDGETPQQRVVTIVSIDCSTPQSRLHDTNGILFNGGTPLNRQLAS